MAKSKIQKEFIHASVAMAKAKVSRKRNWAITKQTHVIVKKGLTETRACQLACEMNGKRKCKAGIVFIPHAVK
jgi:hypothetical protein